MTFRWHPIGPVSQVGILDELRQHGFHGPAVHATNKGFRLLTNALAPANRRRVPVLPSLLLEMENSLFQKPLNQSLGGLWIPLCLLVDFLHNFVGGHGRFRPQGFHDKPLCIGNSGYGFYGYTPLQLGM